jgi:hypothetical protein
MRELGRQRVIKRALAPLMAVVAVLAVVPAGTAKLASTGTPGCEAALERQRREYSTGRWSTLDWAFSLPVQSGASFWPGLIPTRKRTIPGETPTRFWTRPHSWPVADTASSSARS